MVKVSRLGVPLTVKVTVAVFVSTKMLAAEMFLPEVKLTVPTPALNHHPLGGVKIRVTLVPSAKSVFTPSVITMLPRAVKAAPLVELSALSAEILLPPVGAVTVTAACATLAAHTASPDATKSIASFFFIDFKWVTAAEPCKAAMDLSGVDCITSDARRSKAGSVGSRMD